MAIDVVLAADYLVVREAIRALLEIEGDCSVVGVAGDGYEAIRLVRQLRPKVVVLDFCEPPASALNAARLIRALGSDIRTVLITARTEATSVLDALQAGVRGYVVKTQTGAELLQAIKDVVRGNLYVSPCIWHSLVGTIFAKSDPAQPALTERELRVLQLTAEGKSSREIADLLGSSSRTVDATRAHIMCKLDINDRPGLVKYALRRGLITS